jgi:hypothetical protein
MTVKREILVYDQRGMNDLYQETEFYPEDIIDIIQDFSVDEQIRIIQAVLRKLPLRELKKALKI